MSTRTLGTRLAMMLAASSLVIGACTSGDDNASDTSDGPTSTGEPTTTTERVMLQATASCVSWLNSAERAD